MTVVEARGLCKTFDNGVRAVRDLDLSVRRGEIFGFLGPNGAGKTTTVRLLNGTLTPSAGVSIVLGLASSDDRIRKRTSTLAELARMYENLSLRQNLLFFARMYDLPAEQADRRIRRQLERMGLWEKRDLKLGSFSTGMRKKAALARTLLHSPEVVFLDEPTGGLDPEAARQVVTLIRELAEEEKVTVFMCTHDLTLAEGICDTFGFIAEGRLLSVGSGEELIDATWKERKVRIRTLDRTHIVPFEKEEEIDALIRRVMDCGERVVEVRNDRPSLEEIYFQTVGRDRGAKPGEPDDRQDRGVWGRPVARQQRSGREEP